MILGAVSTQSPFDVPDLCWCEAGFAVADLQDLAHDGVALKVPDELRSAVPKRRSEYLAGRFCAALALRQAGLPGDVGRKGRAPVWPPGVAGSITHSRDRAIAAVSTRYQGLGLDCEAMVAADRATQLAAVIFSEAEARLRPEALTFGAFFTLVFSAKEALYKALSPRLDRIPDFRDVTLTALEPGQMELVLDGETHVARFRLSARDCVTLVVDQGL